MPRDVAGGPEGALGDVAGEVGWGVGCAATAAVVVVTATGGAVVAVVAGGIVVVVVVGDGAKVVVAGVDTVVVGAGCGRLPGFGVGVTGRATVVSGASVVGVGEPGTDVVGVGSEPRRGAGGTIAGLLGAPMSLPMMAVNSQRSGLAGANSTFASMRPSSFFVVVGSSNSISFSIGAFSPRAS